MKFTIRAVPAAREHPNGGGAALPDPGDHAAGHVTADCVVVAKDGALAPCQEHRRHIRDIGSLAAESRGRTAQASDSIVKPDSTDKPSLSEPQISLALYQPDIAGNTGTILRLGCREQTTLG